MSAARRVGRSAAVDAINAGQQVTCDPVEMQPEPASELAETIRGASTSVDAVLADVVDHVVSRVVHKLVAEGIRRRRSVTEVLTQVFDLFWDDVRAHLDEYRAAMILQGTRPDLPTFGPTGAVSLGELPQAWVVRGLTEIARLQNVTWDRPVPLLSRWLVATLRGLITDVVCRPEARDTRQLLGVFAYEFAEHSHRNHRRRDSAV